MYTLTKGKVVDIDDPAKAGRIKCDMAEVEGTYPEWINPVFMGSWVWMPNVNDNVMIVIPDDENITEFSSEIYYLGKISHQEDPIHGELRAENYGNRRGTKTKAGHIVIVDDTDGGEEITISYKGSMVISWKPDGIFIGSSNATEPFVLGSQLQSLLSAVLGDLATHTHAGVTVGAGVSGIPSTTANYLTWKSEVDGGQHLSDFIYGQKIKP